jgi:HAD superfamily hydrolase (TIGR01509 family)
MTTAGPGLQLVIFDCDGVLVDSEPISHRVLVDMLSELGVEIGFDEAVELFIGSTLPRCLELVAQLLGRPPPADFAPQFGQRTRRAFSQALRPVAGVEALLAWLPVPCCVASNGNRAKMEFTLGHTGLLWRFEGRMYHADEVAHPKPAPDLFLHAARRHGAQPAQCVVIEDTPTGIVAARAAGMRAFGFAALTPASRLRQAGADTVFSRMDELRALLAPLARVG